MHHPKLPSYQQPDEAPAPYQPYQPPRPAQPAPVPAPANLTEERAKRFLIAYFDLWSTSGTNVTRLGDFYAPNVNFFKTMQPRSYIMDQKAQFSFRWPIRRYVIQPGTVYVSCTDLCTVTGVVEWETTSPERGERSRGSAAYTFKVYISDSAPFGALIMSEDGSTIEGHKESLGSPSFGGTPSSLPAPYRGSQSEGSLFEEGRQARAAFQAWIDSLAPGDYRDGALFWTANRSSRQPPSCSQMGTSLEWQQGCAASRERLAGNDVRRRTEPQFRLGWNSY